MRESGAGNTGQSPAAMEVATVTLSTQEYREIPLTKGRRAIVDAADYERITAFKWQTQSSKQNPIPYALAHVWIDGHRRSVSMHRMVMGLGPGHPDFIDHINGDTLDNRRSNLRVATPAQNAHNSRKPNTNKSGFKGVSWHRRGRKWQATIMHEGKWQYLGLFNTAEEAHAAYCDAARRLHGEFARMA